MVTITTDLFIDKFSVTLNEFTQSALQKYLDRYSLITLNELFGVELFDLWDANPINPIYSKLTEPFIFQNNNNEVFESKGVIELLLGVIYYNYTSDIISRQTLNVSVQNSSENSVKSSAVNSRNWQRYNESIETYIAIQNYIEDNRVVYPTYNGVRKPVIIPYF